MRIPSTFEYKPPVSVVRQRPSAPVEKTCRGSDCAYETENSFAQPQPLPSQPGLPPTHQQPTVSVPCSLAGPLQPNASGQPSVSVTASQTYPSLVSCQPFPQPLQSSPSPFTSRRSDVLKSRPNPKPKTSFKNRPVAVNFSSDPNPIYDCPVSARDSEGERAYRIETQSRSILHKNSCSDFKPGILRHRQPYNQRENYGVKGPGRSDYYKHRVALRKGSARIFQGRDECDSTGHHTKGNFADADVPESRKRELNNQLRDFFEEQNRSANRSPEKQDSRERATDGKAKGKANKPVAPPIAVEVYDIKDFVSLPDDVLDALACTKTEGCHHDHSKYRMIGKKLYVLSTVPNQQKETEDPSSDETVSNERSTTERAPIIFSNQPNKFGDKNCSKVVCREEKATKQTQDIALSSTHTDAGTQMSNTALRVQAEHKTVVAKAATVSITTQCPSSSAIAKVGVHKRSQAVGPDSEAGNNITENKQRKSQSKTTSITAEKTSSQTHKPSLNKHKKQRIILSDMPSPQQTVLSDTSEVGNIKVEKSSKNVPLRRKVSQEQREVPHNVINQNINPSPSAVNYSLSHIHYKPFTEKVTTVETTEQLLTRKSRVRLNKTQEGMAKQGALIHTGDNAMMPPPPFGYHVRNDYSSSESTLEAVRKIKIDRVADDSRIIGNRQITGSKKKKNTEVSVSGDSAAADKCIPKKCREHAPSHEKANRTFSSLSKSHPGRSDDKKRPKKLMIIGKLNYFKMGKKGGKPRLQFGISHRGNHKERLCKHKKDHSRHSQRRYIIRSKSPELAEGKRMHDKGYEKKATIIPADDSCFPLSQSSVLYYYEPLSHPADRNDKHQSHTHIHCHSASLHQSHKNLNHNATTVCPNKPQKTMRPCFTYRPWIARRLLATRKFMSPSLGLSKGKGLLPSYYLNINTNAGDTDTMPERNGDGHSGNQTSATSVHSSDQYYSVHTDSPEEKNGESDIEVSPSGSFTEEPDKFALGRPVEPEILNQEKQSNESWEEKKHTIMQACNEAIKSRMQRKNLEQISSDELMELPDKQVYRTSPTLPTPINEVSGATNPSKHNKKKTKTTEALYIKFESSLSKKVTTTVLKDGRRVPASKPQKLPPSGDTVRAINNVPEKHESPRYTKIVKVNDGIYETSRLKQPSDTHLELDISAPRSLVEETNQAASPDIHSVRPVLSDHKYQGEVYIVNDLLYTNRPNKAADHVTETMHSSPKEIPSQESPYTVSIKDPKSELSECDKALEQASSVVTVVQYLPQSKEPPKATPKEDPEKSRAMVSPPKEGSKKIEIEKEFKCTNAEAYKTDMSPSSFSQGSLRKASTSRKVKKGRPQSDRPRRKPSPETVVKVGVKVKKLSIRLKSKTTEDIPKESSSKKDGADSTKGRSSQAVVSSMRRKSPLRRKSRSRSPDGKKKKRCVRKKEADGIGSDTDDSKANKSKKDKCGDKSPEKKKKKIKSKSISDDEEYLSSQKQRKDNGRSSSKSPEFQKATQTVLSSISPPISPQTSVGFPPHKSKSACDDRARKTFSADKQVHSDEGSALPSKEVASRVKQRKLKSHEVVSAENVSVTSKAGTQIRSAESVPTFTGTVYKAPTRVVHVPTCPKTKKSEKDLQQAEMGWNSSVFSDEKGVAAEKVKKMQKRNKVRYYIVKPTRPKKGDREAGVSKLKRPGQRFSRADGDSATTGGESSLRGDALQRERNGAGQVKSVQFSDSIQELEVVGNDHMSLDVSASPDRQDSDMLMQQLELDSTEDCTTTSLEPRLVDVKQEVMASKPEQNLLKKEQRESESKPHGTPPRRKRPVWLKKSTAHSDHAEKSNALSKSNAGPKTTHVPAILPMKFRHSSDNMLKPTSRFKLQLVCPTKPNTGSPKWSNLNLCDRKTVGYNSWINSVFLAAPMNKATKKVVAKVGSPVDIKEIIEGSSVDAADHFRAMRSLHEAGLRSAKSASALGSQKSSGTDLLGGKRTKQPGEARVKKGGKETKLTDNGPARSLSFTETHDDSVGKASTSHDLSVSPIISMSTDIDEAAGIQVKQGHGRTAVHGHPRKKDKKQGKKQRQTVANTMDWQLMAAQSPRSDTNLTRIHYYGDMMDFNVLNMGLSWMVQGFFRRLSFLNRGQQGSSSASGDMPTNQQLVE